MPGAAAQPADNTMLPSDHPIRMALLLPLHSESLGPAAEAVRAGVMAAWERDRANITVEVLDTGDVPQDVLSIYAHALEQKDIVIGPLSRSAVAAVAASPLVARPTIALNYPEGYGLPGAMPLPPNMLAMGLSIEEEARQVAQWAAAEHPGRSALILSTASPWQRRVVAAFAAQWQQLGQPFKQLELGTPSGALDEAELAQLRTRLQAGPPGLLFSAMDANQTRRLRQALGSASEAENPAISTADAMPPPPAPAPAAATVPMYATSAANPGDSNDFPAQELDGLRLLDLPWQVQRDHPAVMVYPRPQPNAGGQAGSADMDRLYALGIDAFRVARELGLHPMGRFQLDGVTGKLTIDFGQGDASFERVEQTAVYRNGAPQPLHP